MGELSRKLKKMRRDDDAAQAARRRDGETKPKATKARKNCNNCGADMSTMTDKHAAQHVARCLGD